MSLNTKRIVIFVLGLALAVALFMVADQERRRHLEPEQMSVAQRALISPDSKGCVECHTKESPAVVEQWAMSKHAEKGVGCLDCHGAERGDLTAWNHESTYVTSIVSPATCAECHPKENTEFAASHHNTAGMILHSKDNMLGEFVAGGPNAVLGCKQCHGSQLAFTKVFEDGSEFTLDMRLIANKAKKELEKEGIGLKKLMANKGRLTDLLKAEVAKQWEPHKGKAPKSETALKVDPETWPNSGMGRFNPDGSLGSCNACHSRHSFSKALARQPENCGKCHMGPDHPQIEIYNESKHGIAFRNQLAEMNLDDEEWIVGEDYSAAPTCATCHMSAYRAGDKVVPVSHDIGLRISWTLRPPVSVRKDSHSAIYENGKAEGIDVKWDQKRQTMKGVCRACHSNSHIEGFYTQFDGLVNLYNEKFAKPGIKIMNHIKAKGYLTTADGGKGFAHELNWIWFELWHHEGRRMRHGASMMGPDYTHWHGSYEVAKHFYVKFLPKVLKMAKEKHDDELKKLVEEELKRPEHEWRNGMDDAEAERLRKHYRSYPTKDLEK